MSKDIIPNSIIGEGAKFSGTFKVAGSFRIDGYYSGKLTVDDHLFVSPIGKVKTDTVYTKTISVAGIFMGNIEASEEVQLLSTGRVLGNIKSPKLIMEPGVVVQGSIDIISSKGEIGEIIHSSFKNEEDALRENPKKQENPKERLLVKPEEQENPKERLLTKPEEQVSKVDSDKKQKEES